MLKTKNQPVKLEFSNIFVVIRVGRSIWWILLGSNQ